MSRPAGFYERFSIDKVRYAGDGEPGLDAVFSNGRYVLRLYNQGGYDCTEIDLFDLLDWAQTHGKLLEKWRADMNAIASQPDLPPNP